jgi:hypothetical protein
MSLPVDPGVIVVRDKRKLKPDLLGAACVPDQV